MAHLIDGIHVQVQRAMLLRPIEIQAERLRRDLMVTHANQAEGMAGEGLYR